MKIAWMLLCTIAGVTVRPAREVIDVDLIELNHVHRVDSCEGRDRHVFSQIVFWRSFAEPEYDARGRWVGTVDRMHAVGWVFAPCSRPSGSSHGQVAGPDRLPGGIVRVLVGRHEVRSALYRESHTTHDVEREDVMRYPKVERPNLFTTTASAAVATISETP